jgi:hypothetical protein
VRAPNRFSSSEWQRCGNAREKTDENQSASRITESDTKNSTRSSKAAKSSEKVPFRLILLCLLAKSLAKCSLHSSVIHVSALPTAKGLILSFFLPLKKSSKVKKSSMKQIRFLLICSYV